MIKPKLIILNETLSAWGEKGHDWGKDVTYGSYDKLAEAKRGLEVIKKLGFRLDFE